MSPMMNFLLYLHVACCILLIICVLLQPSKTEVSSAWSSNFAQHWFGGQGSSRLMYQLTWGLTFIFFAMSLAINVQNVQKKTQTPLSIADQMDRIPNKK